MRVGFTGTREGMTSHQKKQVAALLAALVAKEGHHGDCYGSDEDFHRILKFKRLRIIGHPPDKNSHRAFCDFDESKPPLPYLTRNKGIVLQTEALIATPAGYLMEQRSGTWSTVRFAVKGNKIVFVVLPDGMLLDLNQC